MMETVLGHAIAMCSGGGSGVTTQAAGSGSGLSLSSFDWTGLFVFGAVVAVFATGVVLAVFIANRISDRPLARVPIPAHAPISPDGYYWWDGAAWRPRF